MDQSWSCKCADIDDDQQLITIVLDKTDSGDEVKYETEMGGLIAYYYCNNTNIMQQLLVIA